MSKSEAKNNVEQLLGKPIGFNISDQADKVRRLVVIASAILLFLLFGGGASKDTLTLFGITFTGITPDRLMLAATIALSWLLIHFVWYSIENLKEWRIRITGFRSAFPHSGLDIDPPDPKQMTIYSWWITQSRDLSGLSKLIDGAGDDLALIKRAVANVKVAEIDERKILEVKMVVDNLFHHFNNIAGQVASVKTILEAPHIEAGLSRFNSSLKHLFVLQNLRVLVIDIVFPAVLASVALVFALMSIYRSYCCS